LCKFVSHRIIILANDRGRAGIACCSSMLPDPMFSKLLKGFVGFRWTAVLLTAGLITLGITYASFIIPSAPVTPGGPAVGVPLTSAAPGTLLAFLASPFSFATVAGTTSGTISSAVYRNGSGTLDFYYQVANNAGSATALSRLSATNFVGFQTALAFRLDGGSLAGTGFSNGTPGIIPVTGDRDASATTVGFNFVPTPPGTKIPPGTTSAVLVISTDATNFTAGNAEVIDGGTQTVAAFQPLGVQPCTTTPPAVALTAVIAGPPKQIQITVQDADDGLKSIVVTTSTNATTVVPPFTVGTTSPVVVTATKIDQTLDSSVTLTVTDVCGNVTTADFEFGGTALNPPVIIKKFGAATVPLNGSTTLSFTITNPNAAGSLTGVGFTDTLPAGLVVSTPNGLTGTCGGGTITATAGSGTVSLSGATLPGLGSCTFSVNVIGTTAGVQNNSVTVTSTNGGTGNTSTAVLTVVAPPTIIKKFGATTIPPNGSTSLSFTITNPNANAPLSGIGFTDNLPAGLVVATPNGLTGSCGGGSITATAGSGTVSLAGATLAAGASCTFSLNVLAVTDGVKNNSTGSVTSTEGGSGPPASATLRVASPPTLTKAFADAQIQVLGPNSTALSFTLTNPNTATMLTGLAFTDTLPSGLVVSTPNGLIGSCGGGTITAIAGSNSISLASATLAPGASCTFSVNVTGTEIGVQTNTTSTVSSNEAIEGAPATATTSVVNLFFQWFFLASGGGAKPPI
jgi:hypothetical protein